MSFDVNWVTFIGQHSATNNRQSCCDFQKSKITNWFGLEALKFIPHLRKKSRLTVDFITPYTTLDGRWSSIAQESEKFSSASQKVYGCFPWNRNFLQPPFRPLCLLGFFSSWWYSRSDWETWEWVVVCLYRRWTGVGALLLSGTSWRQLFGRSWGDRCPRERYISYYSKAHFLEYNLSNF